MNWFARFRLRRQWHTVKTWQVNCLWTDFDPPEPAGTILIAGQENGLGERRVVALNKVWGWKAHETRMWAQALLWREGQTGRPMVAQPKLRVVK